MRLILLLLLALNLYAERIIALSPAIAEILFAVGRGSEVVGVSDYTVFPKAATLLPKIGDYFQPNLETIVSLRPTLVVGQSNHADLLQQLQQLHIATKMVHLEHIDSIIDSIAQLGNHTTQAHARIKEIETAKHRYHNVAPSHRVLIVFGLFSNLRDPIYASGPNLFFDEILEICGTKNAIIATIPKQPVLTYESLIALNPDTILIINSNHNLHTNEALQAWYKVPVIAAKNGRIIVLDEDYLAMPSHRIAQSIATICKALR